MVVVVVVASVRMHFLYDRRIAVLCAFVRFSRMHRRMFAREACSTRANGVARE